MLKLYYHPVSANSRRVWIALLEKNIPVERVALNLDGDQHQPAFLSLNPFHQIPVLIDGDFRIIESIAILDYLETKYPLPAMLPRDAQQLAIVRMVQMVTTHELVPATIQLSGQVMGLIEPNLQKQEQAKQKISTVLTFFETHFAEHCYLGGNDLTLADIVAGTVVPGLADLGISLDDYPKLKAWTARLITRPSWQATQPSREVIAAFMPQMKDLMTARS